MKLKKLPEAEQEIMLRLWEIDSEVNSDTLLNALDKDWVKPTLLNLLSRLCIRGYVKMRKDGRYNMYSPIVTKEEYLQNTGEGILNKLFSGSVTGLVASLYDGKSITKEDLAELEEYIRSVK